MYYSLVKGKLMVKFEKNPSGGYLTKGNDNDGAITSVVPGGRAKRPSSVSQRILFCLDLAPSFVRDDGMASRIIVRMFMVFK